MSDFQRDIIKRSHEMQAERLRVAAEQEARQIQEAAQRAEDERKAQKQLLRMGKDVIELLQKYQIPSLPIWERLPTCPQETHTIGPKLDIYSTYSNDAQYYSPVGRGWEICYTRHYDSEGNTFDMHLGITDTSQVVTNMEESWLKGSDNNGAGDALVGELATAPAAIGILNSVDFQNGVASLIGGLGVYRDLQIYS